MEGTAAQTIGSAPLASSRRLPALVGFRTEILPLLVLLWIGIIIGFLVTGREYLWPIGVWASLTLTMLWPVGRSLGRPYFSYRRPAFVIAVLTMAYIPLTGFVIQSDLSFSIKTAVFFGLLADLTVFGIVPSLPWSHARPITMFFRPDLLFGDGRILATGILALVFGIRYMMGPKPADALWALPQWEWYAILLAMIGGLIPMIAGRGMAKLLMRMQRVRFDRWYGWGGVILKEAWLIVTMMGIAFGFRQAFVGKIPFTVPIKIDHALFWEAIAIMMVASLWLIFVRGGYKKLIGEPFIKETIPQTIVKEVLLIVSLVPFFYAFMSMLQGRWLGFNSGYMLFIGLIGFWWGVLMLTLFRVIGQEYQRRGILKHMAAVILPHQQPEIRVKVMQKMLDALYQMKDAKRMAYMKAMNEGLASAPEEVRTLMTGTMVSLLVDSAEAQRMTLMETQAASLGKMSQQERVVRMADMMGAVSQLPEEQRRMMMEKMASMLV